MTAHYATPDATLHHGDCLGVLRQLPDNSVDAIVTDRNVTDLAAGTAAEHIVCADLLLAGYRAFMADQNCPYDVAVEVNQQLVRIQVKAIRQPRLVPQVPGHRAPYLFHARRAGKRGTRRYGVEELDILALVALDVRKIGYLALVDVPTTVLVRSHADGEPAGPNGGGRTGRTFAEMTFARALAESGHV